MVLCPCRAFSGRAHAGPSGLAHLGAAANGGFDPDLLVAVSYRLRAANSYTPSDTFLDDQTGGRLRFDTDLLLSFEPASPSRDGLLVLRRTYDYDQGICIQRADDDVELLVCNTITGHVTSIIPSIDLRDPHPTTGGQIRSDIYPPVLLSTDGGGRSFELLVLYNKYMGWSGPLEVQIFSSQEAVWGAARRIQLPRDVGLVMATSSTASAVIGRSVHWPACPAFRDGDLFVLALHVDEPVQATVVKMSPELLASIG
jgi:hypothetical protein